MASGFLFLGATEEQMALLTSYDITHVAYILVLYSFAFLLFLFVNILLHIYAVNASPSLPPKDIEADSAQRRGSALVGGWEGRRRGHRHTESEHLRDAEEFELGALLSDDEGAEDARERRGGEETPSTLGKNSEVRV